MRAGDVIPAGRRVSLTARQHEVLSLVAEGLANKEIACQLGITIAAVKKHVSTMMAAFDVPNRTSLVRTALHDRLGEDETRSSDESRARAVRVS